MKPIAFLNAAVCCACLGLTVHASDLEGAPRLVRFDDNGKIGFKNEAGDVVIRAQYDKAGDFACGLAPVNLGAIRRFPGFIKDGGKWGYINDKGEVVVPITLEYAWEFSDGLAKVAEFGAERYRNGPTRYIDSSGKTVITLSEGTGGQFSEGLAPVHRATSDGKWWRTEYIDKKGKTVFSIRAYGEEFHEGLAAASAWKNPTPADPESSLTGFIGKEGNWVVQPKYAGVREFSEGLAAVRSRKTTATGAEDTWGYIDRQGKLVIGFRFNEAHSFDGAVALVHAGGVRRIVYDAPCYWQDGEWLIIDKTGRVLKRSTKWIDADDFAQECVEGDKK